MTPAPDAIAPGQLAEMSPRYAGWRAVFTCFLMALFIFGFGFYGQAVYLAELQRLHGWPAALIAGASTISLLLGNVLVIFTDDLVARLGQKRLVLLGLAALVASMALVAFATEPWQLYAAFVLMAFGWVGMGTVMIATIIGDWFVHRRGLAISLAFNGASCGGVVVTPLLVLLVEKLGFAAAMLTATAIMVAVMVPAVVGWIGNPPRRDFAEGGEAEGSARPLPAAAGPITRATILRGLPFWTVSIPFALALVAQIGFIVHAIALLEPRIGRSGAGFAVSLMTFMALAGRLGLGLVVDRLDPRWTTAVSFASQAAALLTITQTDSVPMMLAACAVFGLSAGNLITLPPLIIHREFDAMSFTLVMGLSTAVSGTVGALGPGLVGLVRGWSGDYNVALALCIALELIAAAIVVQRRLVWRPAAAEGRG